MTQYQLTGYGGSCYFCL